MICWFCNQNGWHRAVAIRKTDSKITKLGVLRSIKLLAKWLFLPIPQKCKISDVLAKKHNANRSVARKISQKYAPSEHLILHFWGKCRILK
jgi:hypothetical protein